MTAVFLEVLGHANSRRTRSPDEHHVACNVMTDTRSLICMLDSLLLQLVHWWTWLRLWRLTSVTQRRPSPWAYEASPCFRKICNKSLWKHIPNTFSRKISPLYPPKFLMTFFSHWALFSNFSLSGYKCTIIPSYFPHSYSIFPLFFKSPYFSYVLTLHFFPLKLFDISFPPNLTKTFVFPPKIPNFRLKSEWWRFLLHSLHGMDAPGVTYAMKDTMSSANIY